MKKLIRLAAILAAFFICGRAYAQVAVSGNLKDVGISNVTGSNTYVRFALQNFGTNIPKVTGTNVIVNPSVNLYPNSSGNISGNIQGNDTISPAGTFYKVCIFYKGQQFECASYGITGSAFVLSIATPLTTAPVVPAPTGDSTYIRTDAGNQSSITNLSTFPFAGKAANNTFSGINVFSQTIQGSINGSAASATTATTATTASALSSVPTNCGAGVAATGVGANGNAVGCFAAASALPQTSATTNFGTNLTTQTIVASVPVTGMVIIYTQAVTTTIGVGCSAATNSVTGTYSFTAPSGAVVSTLGINGLSFSGNGIVDIGSSGSGVDFIVAKAGTAITYTATSSLGSTGCTTVPQYTIYAKAIF